MARTMFIKNNFLKKKVKDLILDLSKTPVVKEKTILKETLEKMVLFKIGMACVVNKNNLLLGVITDGDLRRKLLENQKPWGALLNDDTIIHCRKNPITINYNDNLKKALNLIIKKRVWDLPVLDNRKHLIGIIHLQNILNLVMKND